MKFWKKIKDFYYRVEEKFYSFVDNLGEKNPIYKAVVFLEERRIRAFWVFIGILVFLLSLTIYAVWPKYVEIELVLKDQKHNLAKGVQYELILSNGKTMSGQFDAPITLKVPKGVHTIKIKENQDYKKYTGKLDCKDGGKKVVYLKKKQKYVTRTYTLTYPNGSTYTDPISLTIKCVNGDYEKELEVSGGEITLDDVPEDCSSLRFSGDGIDTIVGRDDVLVEVSGLEFASQKYDVSFYVRDESSNPIAGAVVSVEKDGVEIEWKETDNGGVVVFSLEPGDYSVVVSDVGNGQYSSYRGTFSVNGNETYNIVLQERYVGELSVKVVDKETQEPIKNARVSIYKANEKIGECVSGEDGYAKIKVTEDVEYGASVEATGYLKTPIVKGIVLGNENVIEMERLDSPEIGILKIKVVNGFGSPVEHAEIRIYTKENFPIEVHKYTGVDGEYVAKLKEGQYYVRVIKGQYSAKSEPVNVVKG